MAGFTLGSAKSAVREGIVADAQSTELIEIAHRSAALDSPTEEPSARVRLVSDDFPFDESQLNAVTGMVASRFACLTGAAGTGKTTTTKRFVDELLDVASLGRVDLSGYWKADAAPVDADDQYDSVDGESVVESIAMCAYTGKAAQQIKGNFPTSWHGNIMTIHRLLGFVPETYEDYDAESGVWKNKMRFVPTYNAQLLLPWDVIIIDEAGMLGLDLWHQLIAACKPSVRIYMIGDIDQLAPIYGKSVFGFAMARWPTFELAEVHRQAGTNNPIVDNAWRVIHGIRPQTEGVFKMVEMPVESLKASSYVRALARKLHSLGVYKPLRDVIITPIHGINPGPGAALGDYPLNEHLSMMFGSENAHPRFVIDGGREKKLFAVGDKVMATKNDWPSGITNGMTGHIVDIIENAGYTGSRMHYGTLAEVNARFARGAGSLPEDEVDLDDLDSMVDSINENAKKAPAAKESRDRGPASHSVVIEFGSGDAAFQKVFESLAEVGTLQLAYAMTCHKMQGGECPTVVIVLHESHSGSLSREWLYTAITRASKNCILVYTDRGLRIALNRQAIPGSSLRDKVLAFQRIMFPRGVDEASAAINLPVSESPYPSILDQDIQSDDRSRETERRLTAGSQSTGLAKLVSRQRQQQQQQQSGAESEAPDAGIRVEIRHTVNVNIHVTEPAQDPDPVDEPVSVYGGRLTPIKIALPPPTARIAVPCWGAARTLVALRHAVEGTPKMLTYQPATQPSSPEPKSVGLTLGQLFAKSKGR
jgi:ATP-dependent exoDNAse (exonuclease V) alpha subunit